MIEFIKTWANQIIVAIIIATILEMILPNGNNKKYIKMVIGLYVLFTIVQPIIIKFAGINIDISNFKYNKYFKEEVLEVSTEEFESNNSKLIKQAYIDNIQKDIEKKIEQKGYRVISFDIEILESENEENYGIIKSMSLKLNKIEEEETNKEYYNAIKIEDIDIDASNNINSTNSEEKLNLSNGEKIKIIEYLSEEYSVEKKNIVIN